jgi:hypothetical protein
MTGSTFVVGLMLAASALLSGCPETLGGLNDFETGDETGDEDSSDSVNPDPTLGWVADGGESSETGETGDEDPLPKTEETGDDACGDEAVQRGEECDGWNTNFETCSSLGFVAGRLGCTDDCTFDVSGCVAPGCGNGVLETVETCDGSPYPCWLLGYAGSSDVNGMTACQDDCTPSEDTCDPICEWGQPGCFCDTNSPCPDAYACMPHPQGWENAPGTCELAACNNVGSACGLNTPDAPCCPNLDCIDFLCV